MARVQYQARFEAPAYIERARGASLRLPLFTAGALAAPSSGTITIYNAANEVVINAAAVTISGSIAGYDVDPSDVTGQAFGASWRVEWSLVMPDTETHLFRQSGALVRALLYPVITDADLLRRHSDLDSHLESGTNSFEDYIEEAWVGVQSRLVEMGRRPYLIISPEALRNVHLFETLEVICTDFAGDGDPSNKWTMLAEKYRSEAETAWARVNFEYDEDDDGDSDGGKRTSGVTSVWMGSVRA